MKVLLLVSKSRESQNKANQLRLACSRLGWECDVATWFVAGYDIEIPCSDSMVSQSRFGQTSSWLGSKIESAKILKSLGLPYIETIELKDLNAVKSCEIKGPVFIKSDKSSGTASPHAFGYKRYDSIEAFYDVAKETDFDSPNYQGQFGSYVVQPFIENDGMVTVSYIGGKPLAESFVKTDTDCFYEYMHFSAAYDYGQSMTLKALSDFAGVPFLYVQGLMVDGVMTPIDINIRLSTYLDSLMSHYSTEFYVDCLRAIAGESVAFDVPEALIGRIKTDWSKSSWSMAKGEVQLNFGANKAAVGKFDAAYSYPTYVIYGDDVLNRRQQFLKSVEVVQ